MEFFIHHSVAHWCKPPLELEPEKLGMNLSVWKDTFLPLVMGPTFQLAHSGCHMYNVTRDDVPGLLNGSIKAEDFGQVECRSLNGYDYDRR